MKKITRVVVFVLIFVVYTGVVSAANIGISPARLSFDKVLRGGYAEKNVIVSVDLSEPVGVVVTPRGEVADWINVSSLNFSVERDEPSSLRVSVNPPEDMPNGNYTGFLRVMTSGLGEGIEGHAVGIVRSSLDLAITVEVTDIEVVDCYARDFVVQSVEEGDDIVFSMDVSNRGNVRLKPRVVIDIWDQDQIVLEKTEEFFGGEILPTTEDSFEFRVSSEDLELGQYWADVSVIDCYSSQTLTFDVLEEGALKADGILMGIIAERVARVGDTIPISVKFKNTGEKDVDAQFKGKITSGEKIIQILETDKFNVAVEEVTDFSLFFTPKEAGKYIVSGRVFYDGKRTFESSAPIDVVESEFSLSGIIAPAVYLVLIILIALLFFRIRKERKLYLSKLKQIR